MFLECSYVELGGSDVSWRRVAFVSRGAIYAVYLERFDISMEGIFNTPFSQLKNNYLLFHLPHD